MVEGKAYKGKAYTVGRDHYKAWPRTLIYILLTMVTTCAQCSCKPVCTDYSICLISDPNIAYLDNYYQLMLLPHSPGK